MKIKQSRRRKTKWVVSENGKPLTPKYDYMYELRTWGPYSYVEAWDDTWARDNPKPRRCYVFDTEKECPTTEAAIESVDIVNDNIIAFRFDGKYSFFNKEGKLLINNVEYYQVCTNHPYVRAIIDDFYYFLDENMKIITDPFKSATDFDKYGYSVVQDVSTNKYRIMDTDFLAFPLHGVECINLRPLSKDFFAVIVNPPCSVMSKDGKWTLHSRCGVMDKDGNWILQPEYDNIPWQKNGHFKLEYNGKNGLADLTGKIVFECFYDEIMETPNKFAVRDFSRLEADKVLETKKTE